MFVINLTNFFALPGIQTQTDHLHGDLGVFVEKGKGTKQLNLYSAFIVPHTQGAQVQITQCYLQITPYLPLPRKRSPDGASPD